MPTPQEQFAELQRQSLDAAMKIAQLSMRNTQRMLELQLDTARELLDEGVKNAQAIAEVKDPASANALRERVTNEATQTMLGCAKAIAEIATDTQKELQDLFKAQGASNPWLETVQRAMQGMQMPGGDPAAAVQSAMDNAKAAFDQMTKASTDAMGALGAAMTPAGGKGKKTGK